MVITLSGEDWHRVADHIGETLAKGEPVMLYGADQRDGLKALVREIAGHVRYNDMTQQDIALPSLESDVVCQTCVLLKISFSHHAPRVAGFTPRNLVTQCPPETVEFTSAFFEEDSIPEAVRRKLLGDKAGDDN